MTGSRLSNNKSGLLIHVLVFFKQPSYSSSINNFVVYRCLDILTEKIKAVSAYDGSEKYEIFIGSTYTTLI